MFNVIIYADKYFNNYEFLKEKCDFFLSNKEKEDVTILDPGENVLISVYAAEKGYKIKLIKADWYKHHERYKIIRDDKLTELGNALIAFCGKNSKNTGVKYIKEHAEAKNLLVRVIVEPGDGIIQTIANAIKNQKKE